MGNYIINLAGARSFLNYP